MGPPNLQRTKNAREISNEKKFPQVETPMETPEEKKISPSKNSTVPLTVTLGVLFAGVGGLILAGYRHGHMNIGAVFKNLG